MTKSDFIPLDNIFRRNRKLGSMLWPKDGQRLGNSREHAARLRNQLKLAIVVLEVQRRVPVDRLVLSDRARGAVTVHEVVIGSGLGKA